MDGGFEDEVSEVRMETTPAAAEGSTERQRVVWQRCSSSDFESLLTLVYCAGLNFSLLLSKSNLDAAVTRWEGGILNWSWEWQAFNRCGEW